MWISGTHHIIFSLGFALQSLGFRIVNNLIWVKPDLVPNASHIAFPHAQCHGRNRVSEEPVLSEVVDCMAKAWIR